MKPYIDLNTEKRKEAVMRGDKAGKDLFKLFNNAVFGKAMENLRKDCSITSERYITMRMFTRVVTNLNTR